MRDRCRPRFWRLTSQRRWPLLGEFWVKLLVAHHSEAD